MAFLVSAAAAAAVRTSFAYRVAAVAASAKVAALATLVEETLQGPCGGSCGAGVAPVARRMHTSALCAGATAGGSGAAVAAAGWESVTAVMVQVGDGGWGEIPTITKRMTRADAVMEIATSRWYSEQQVVCKGAGGSNNGSKCRVRVLTTVGGSVTPGIHDTPNDADLDGAIEMEPLTDLAECNMLVAHGRVWLRVDLPVGGNYTLKRLRHGHHAQLPVLLPTQNPLTPPPTLPVQQVLLVSCPRFVKKSFTRGRNT